MIGMTVMRILRYDKNKRAELRGKLDTVFSNMLDLDVNKASLFVNWCMDKSSMFNV